MLFLTVLQWVDYSFTINNELQKLKSELRLFLVWAHTYHIYSIFSSLGVNADSIQETFAKNSYLPIRVFENDAKYENNVLHYRNLNAKLLTTYGITYSIEDKTDFIDKSLQEGIADFVIIKTDEYNLPHPYLLGNLSRADNSLGSFLGKDLSEQLKKILDEELSRLFDHTKWKELSQIVIHNLQENHNSLSSWIDLYAVLGTLPLDKKLEKELSQAILAIDFVKLFESDIELGQQAIHIASLNVTRLNEEHVKTQLRTQLIQISEFLSNQCSQKIFNSSSKGEKDKFSRVAGTLLKSAFLISKSLEEPEKNALEFQKLSIELAKKWAPFGSITKPVIQLLCEVLPSFQAKHIWKLLLYLRAND